jgi:hypothetical protein
MLQNGWLSHVKTVLKCQFYFCLVQKDAVLLESFLASSCFIARMLLKVK